MKKILRMSPWALRNFSEVLEKFSVHPIEGLSYLLPIVAMAISFISHLVRYIMFIVAGGYSEQKNLVLDEGKFFDNGSFEYTPQNIQGYIMLGIFAVSLLLMIIHYYCEEKTIRKVTMSICFVLLLAVGVLFIPMAKNDILDKWVWCVLGAGFIFLLNMYFSNSRDAVTNIISSVCFGYIVIPVFFWLLQNIISVGVLIVIGIVFFIVIQIIANSGDGVSSESYTGSSSKSTYEERMKEKEKSKAISQEKEAQKLRREIKVLEENIWKHNKHEVGYGTIDVKSCEREIEKKRMRLAQLGERY